MLDFDPELSVAVEGKEILVTLPGANYAVTYLLPALNHLRASTSCRAQRWQSPAPPPRDQAQTDPTGVSRAPSTSNAHDGGKIGSTA